ncbi:hypothetical protein [Blastopirellula marina]|uniref:Uncharacterized protein n=1 Tax=Blastopirellula marina DSM 3645 TaxID=314230 RepID=A3ZMU0_9BACT|nr:hypothetical protein [Blastopirellula marina]EAQ82266.1 hypothetical protein DSM3645_01090 [Blastopirellula marina DSM 3645]
MLRYQNALLLATCLLPLFAARASVAAAPSAEKILTGGQLSTEKAALKKYIEKNQVDDRERFGWGVVQFVSAVENMSQSFYDCGVRDHREQLPFLRIVSAENPDPQATSYQDVRNILQRFIDDLKQAEQTLAKVSDPAVKLPLPLFQIQLDLNGDGETTEQETLGAVAAQLRLAQTPAAKEAKSEPIVVAFDYADCLWLRGYCHLLCGIAETYLAYDMEEMHRRVGYLFFEKIDSPHAYLADAKHLFGLGGDVDVVDVIAFIHLINFRVKDADRMQAAHAHFLQVIALSRRTWDAIQTEEDNDREWIPGTKQDSAVSTMKMTPKMLKGWRRFLDEFEAILQGEKLVSHPRITDGRAINVKKVFFEPREFDLVMWIHGSNATPFLEKGPTTEARFWNRLNETYGGEFYNFAIWFN